MCPDVSSTAFESPWRDPRFPGTWPKARNRAAAWPPFFFCRCYQRRMPSSRPVLCFAFAATEKVDIVLRVPHLRQGPAYPGQNPKESNCKPKRAVIHGRFRSEDHGVCSRARRLRAASHEPSATCRFTRGLTQSSDKPAPSLLPSTLFSLPFLPVLPLLPLPALSPLSPFPLPKLLCKSSRTRREGLGRSSSVSKSGLAGPWMVSSLKKKDAT